MKKISLQYGNSHIEIAVPDSADVRGTAEVEPLAKPAQEILRSLDEPIGTGALSQLAKDKDTAAVVVSDNTRPVPYKGPNGILAPIIATLKRSGVGHIKIIVACGTHRPMEEMELQQMLGDAAFLPGIEVINHLATDETVLRTIGSTERTPKVSINRHYLDAQLKIATGLVEPHFMAGFSGGRKAICPGICGRSVTYGLHSASMLTESNAASLILEGNPCHEEALRIAKMAGVDFIVNVTIDEHKRMTGVFSGEMEKAHVAAVEHLRSFAIVEADKLYDVIITHAGDVGVNHYQCAKAVFEASAVVKQGGYIILVGNLTDPDPVGNATYKQMLRLLVQLGPAAFLKQILADDWTFVPDQWQVQMWAKAFRKLSDPKHLYICAPRLESCPQDLIPEVNVAAQTRQLAGQSDIDFVRRITQQTIDHVTKTFSCEKVLVLTCGPYGVPVLKADLKD